MAEKNAMHARSAIEVGIPDFWRDIGAAPHVALLLNYDGTLAPFHVDRLRVVPLDGVVDALLDMRKHTDTAGRLGVSGVPTVVVNGRPLFSGAIRPELIESHLREAAGHVAS